MGNIDSKQVLKLRKKTGLGVMACKKALIETKGDLAKAQTALAGKSKTKAGEKQDREIKAGLIETYSHHNGQVGVILKLGCETDFVAKNKDFIALAHDLALQIASMNPKDVKELLAQPAIKDSKKKIQDLVDQATAKVGERIEVAEFTRLQV